mmetsp:Transcript_11208/g.12350  ORF Transcript_11208/g.12350 Transcript_11208/m.12350 type:complete len:156 (-) Transcript_11208:49-516(-)
MTLARATTALFVLPALSAVAVPDVEISHGVKMPMIAFGTARVSLSSCSVFDGVHQWLQLGGRHIDTAHDYGTEPDVGEALKKSDVKREDIFITTKIPGPLVGASYLPRKCLCHWQLALPRRTMLPKQRHTNALQFSRSHCGMPGATEPDSRLATP